MQLKKNNDIYTKITNNYKINIPFNNLSNNIFNLLEKKLKKKIEDKCNSDGYIKSNSVKLITHSTGELNGNNILFNLTYQCYIANPVESTILECKVSSVTKIGIRAILNTKNNEKSPFVIFIARDHHYNNESFSKINVDDIIKVQVLGKRYELFDDYISIIGELKQ